MNLHVWFIRSGHWSLVFILLLNTSSHPSETVHELCWVEITFIFLQLRISCPKTKLALCDIPTHLTPDPVLPQCFCVARTLGAVPEVVQNTVVNSVLVFLTRSETSVPNICSPSFLLTRFVPGKETRPVCWVCENVHVVCFYTTSKVKSALKINQCSLKGPAQPSQKPLR